MSTTRTTLRQRIAYQLGELIVSTATGGSVSTLLDTSLGNADNTLNNRWLYITSGTPISNERQVSTWTLSTSTFAPRVNFSASPSGCTYELHSIVKASIINNAINEAINLSGIRWVVRDEDTSITTSANKYGYALAAIAIDPSFGIEKVEVDMGMSGTTPPFQEIDHDYWYIRNDAGTLTLQFTKILFLTNSKTMRLTFRKRPAALADDTTALSPDETSFANFIVWQALAILAEDLAVGVNESEGGPWTQKAKRWQRKADGILSKDRVPEEPTPIIMPTWDKKWETEEPDVGVIRV